MKKIFKKCLSLMLCAILVMGTAAAGGDGFLKSHDSFTVRANAASNPYPTSQTFEYNGRWYTSVRAQRQHLFVLEKMIPTLIFILF